MKERCRKPHLVPSQVGDCCADSRISDRDADHEGQRQAAIDDGLAELRVFHVLGIEMERRRIVGQCTEPDIIGFGDRPGYTVPESLPNGEFFEI